jgi:ATP-dependent helicase/nuclease subunit B
LSEQERKRLGETGIVLAPSAEEQTFTEQFYLYLTLTKASEKLIISYARLGEDGTGRRPAYLIGQIKKMFPLLELSDEEADLSKKRLLGCDAGRTYLAARLASGEFRDDRTWWEIASWYERREPGCIRRLQELRIQHKSEAALSREAAQRLYGSEIYGSVTRLERFARCPYAHFLIFGIGLKEREQFRVGVADYGNVFHHAMEHFSHELEDAGKDWQDLSEAEVVSLSDRCIDFVIENYKGDLFHQSKRIEFMTGRMKKILQLSVWGIWKQMKAGNFHQLYSEKLFSGREGLASMKISLDHGKTMTLNGKIDRVDLCEADGKSLLKIMDYKSGKNELNLGRVYHGLQMQLFAYMAAALELQKKEGAGGIPVPAALLYYQMEEPELEWKEESEAGREARMLNALKCSGYVSDDLKVLEQMDRQAVGEGSRSALFPVGFKKDGSFDRYSHILSEEQFARLMQHTREKMAEFGNRIYEGEIGARPYRMEKESGCDYCSFASVCGIEKKDSRRCARELPKMTEEEVWEVLYGNSMDK